ncbi:MAG: DEAD/DEAH box helicase [Vicingaceae bacterium]
MYKVKNNKRRTHAPRNRKQQGRKKNQEIVDVSRYVNKQTPVGEVVAYELKHQFSDFNLDPRILQRLIEKGYINPTEIQDKSIAHMMERKDVIGVAGTGTGKTAAFLLPIIQSLLIDDMTQKALVIAPTRELATQIYDEFKELSRGMNLFATCLIGGIPVHKSIKDLQRKNHIVIGTPGRLADMMQRGHLRVNKTEILVLDEFDRMLDMGFVDEMMAIDEKMIAKEQTLLFSATMDESIRSIVQKITLDPVEIRATQGLRPVNSIEQEILRVPKDANKMDMLHDLIFKSANQKIILFCATKRKVDKIHRQLVSKSIKTDLIHGDKSQRAREVALRKFKNGHIDVLVATDVLARGIDVSDVSLVINYEVPQSYNDYIHRIGRTGRAGKLGKAITFID